MYKYLTRIVTSLEILFQVGSLCVFLYKNMEFKDEEIIISGPPAVEIPKYHSFAHFLQQRLINGGNMIAQISNDTTKKCTYDEIYQNTIKLATSLRKLGVKKGDIVGIMSENRFEFTVTVIAVISIGAVCSPMNILYKKDELLHAIRITKPKFIFCSSLAINMVLNITKDITWTMKLISYEDNRIQSSILYSDLINISVNLDEIKSLELDVHKDPAVVFFSSGTTGLAKAVVLTHYNFIFICHQNKSTKVELSRENDCILSIIPWFHSYGFVSHLNCLVNNIRYVFMAKYEEISFLRAIQSHKVTVANLVPPIVVFLAKHPIVDKFNLSSLREITCGAAPLSKEVIVAVQKRIGVKSIRLAYGLTETTLGVCVNTNFEEKPNSCGALLPGIKAKVVDLKTGQSLGPNKEGELCFKGPTMMLGYMGDKTSTEYIFDRDGWLHTGDVGYYDEDKYFYIVDRVKELIKYKGFQVPPAEIEAILLENKSVKDVGVVGFPDESVGELPTAFVVIQPGAAVTDKNLIEFVAKRLSPQKHLRGGVYFVEQIPKNPSGKILRRELRDFIKKIRTSKL